MPLATPEAQREYQRKWTASRRATYFKGKRCVRCGGTEKLNIHHKDRASKVSHVVWS